MREGKTMSTSGFIILAVVVVVVLLPLVLAMKRRRADRLQERRREASGDAGRRARPPTPSRSRNCGSRRTCRAARREQLAADQNRLTAASHRSSAKNCNHKQTQSTPTSSRDGPRSCYTHQGERSHHVYRRRNARSHPRRRAHHCRNAAYIRLGPTRFTARRRVGVIADST